MRAVAKPPSTIVHMALMDSDGAEGMLGLSPPFEPEATQTAIAECLRRIGQGEDLSMYSKEPANCLGAFWAWMITLGFEWTWQAIDLYENDKFVRSSIGICDPELRYLLLPRELFCELVQEDRHSLPSQIYSAIKHGALPSAELGALLNLNDSFTE